MTTLKLLWLSMVALTFLAVCFSAERFIDDNDGNTYLKDENGRYLLGGRYFLNEDELRLVEWYGEGIAEMPEYVDGYPVTSIGTSEFPFMFGFGSMAKFAFPEAVTKVIIPRTMTYFDLDFLINTEISEQFIPNTIKSIGGDWNKKIKTLILESGGDISLESSFLLNTKKEVGAGYAVKRLMFFNDQDDDEASAASNEEQDEETILSIQDENGNSLIHGKFVVYGSSIIGYTGIKYAPGSLWIDPFTARSSSSKIIPTYYTDEEEITIPGVIDGIAISKISSNVFVKCCNLKKVIIEDGITEIADNAFNFCISLIDIELPASLRVIGDYAFYHCVKLENIVIPYGVTALGNQAFVWCYSLKEVILPSSVVDIGDAVFYHTNLSSIKDENGKLYGNDDFILINNTIIRYLKDERNIVVPETINGNKVTKISDYIFSRKALETIVLPDTITDIGYGTFQYCRNLRKVTLPKGLTELKYGSFHGCKSLQTIDIPDSVTVIDSAFYECTGLTKVILPKGLERIGSNAFSFTNLESIEIPDSVTIIFSYSFSYCYNLANITLPKGLEIIDDGVLVGCKNLSAITIPDSVTTIGSRSFMDCQKLTRITIPSSVTEIGDDAFENCPNLIIYTTEDSYADNYAKENNIRATYIKE